MRRVSTGLSLLALLAVPGLLLLPRGEAPPGPVAAASVHRPDFAASGVDYTPIGTSKPDKRHRPKAH